jgi:hypothetical protein
VIDAPGRGEAFDHQRPEAPIKDLLLREPEGAIIHLVPPTRIEDPHQESGHAGYDRMARIDAPSQNAPAEK